MVTSSQPPTDAPASPRSFTSQAEASEDAGSPRTGTRPGLLRRGRPSSIFGSLKSFRTNDDETTPPATSASSKPPSLNWGFFGPHGDDIASNKTVLHHGEAQTNSSLFWKKKEYIVLTETHLVRFKNHTKAAETFHAVLPNNTRANIVRHASSPSVGSTQDATSAASETSGDKIAAIPLEHIVAVFQPDDATKSATTIEVSYLDVDAAQGANLHFSFQDSDERALWQRSIRQAANAARLQDTDPIPPKLNEYAARVVEREQDYDVTTYRIYKVVKRSSAKSGSNSRSTDDMAKLASAVCFLVVGVHKVHLIVLSKHFVRTSTHSLPDLNDSGSYGIMSMTALLVSATDDTFSLTFRTPFQKPKVLQLASLASYDIALRVRQVEHILRPNWLQRPYICEMPAKIEEQFQPDDPPASDDDQFDRTLIAYCVAYGVNPAHIRYSVNAIAEDAPRFELGESAYNAGRPYAALELLALLRSLRYTDSFGSISFSRIDLTCLNGILDKYGSEHVCTHTASNSRIKLSLAEQTGASLLVQEIRAIAVSSRRLRRLDFSSCIVRPSLASGRTHEAIGCGIVEALFPLCKQQATNVDWIALNGIELQEIDLDYLVSIAAEKDSHFRAIETSGCGLTDRGIALLLDVFRAHDNTLEALDISSNPVRLVPSILSHQLQPFGYIRKLDLSDLAIAAGSGPLLPYETLASWRLEDLRLKGLSLNEQTIDSICAYLSSPQSEVLKELVLSNGTLTGADVATLMQSMTQEPNTARLLHLDVSENNLQKKYKTMVKAIADGLAPTHLSMRSIEYDDEETFEALLLGLAANKSVRYLDLGKTSLPCEADEDTCAALYKLLAENQTLQELDISGEDSRLEVSKLGSGINQALQGLKHNKSLQILRIQYQKLGLQGASTLAEVLKENRTLQQLHCDCNAITLTGFTDLVNALATNTSILFIPNFEEGRVGALRDTEQQIKVARSKADVWASSNAPSKISSMRRTFANIGGGSTTPKGGTKLAAVPQWTEQDVQAALRLVSEGWEGQAQRLDQFLDRNWRMYHGQALDSDAAAMASLEEAHRPGTASSFSQILDRVATESTPRIEKQLQLGDPIDLDTQKKKSSTNDATDGDASLRGGDLDNVYIDGQAFAANAELDSMMQRESSSPVSSQSDDDLVMKASHRLTRLAVGSDDNSFFSNSILVNRDVTKAVEA